MKRDSWIGFAGTAAGIFGAAILSAGALAAPSVQEQGSVSFVSGGVGVTEMEEMLGLSSDYPVELLFVAKSAPNRYLSGTAVLIKDKDDKIVLDTRAQGPVLLAKMPPGKYSITADTDGVVMRDTLRVSARKSRRIVFAWSLPVDTDL